MPNVESTTKNFEAASVFQTQNSPVVDSLVNCAWSAHGPPQASWRAMIVCGRACAGGAIALCGAVVLYITINQAATCKVQDS